MTKTAVATGEEPPEVGRIVLAADSDEPLVCRRCNESGVARLISPYWRPDDTGLCPRCCDAARVHYEASDEGWPKLSNGRRPPKLADVQAFYEERRRFPRPDEIDADTGVISWKPQGKELEQLPDW